METDMQKYEERDFLLLLDLGISSESKVLSRPMYKESRFGTRSGFRSTFSVFLFPPCLLILLLKHQERDSSLPSSPRSIPLQFRGKGEGEREERPPGERRRERVSPNTFVLVLVLLLLSFSVRIGMRILFVIARKQGCKDASKGILQAPKKTRDKRTKT